MKYCRVGEDSNYIYKQVASILEGDLNRGSDSSVATEAMVTRALNYANSRTLPILEQ